MAKFKISEDKLKKYTVEPGEVSNVRNPGYSTFKISEEDLKKYTVQPIKQASKPQNKNIVKAAGDADEAVSAAKGKPKSGSLSAYEEAVRRSFNDASGNYNPQTGINEGYGTVTPGAKPISALLNVIYNKTVNPLANKAYNVYEKLDDYAANEDDISRMKAAADEQAQGQAFNDESLRLNRALNERKEWLSGMTDEQKRTYLALPERERKDYLDSIEDELNQKAGIKEAQYILGQGKETASPAGYAFAAGVQNFKSGLEGAVNLLRGKEGVTAARGDLEYAYGGIAPTLEGGHKVLSDLAYTTGNMAPSMALGFISGGLGTAAMGVSSAGNSYDQAIREGYKPEESAAYGIASGIKEAALQRVAGALPGVSNAQSVLSKALGKYGDKAAKALIKNEALRTSLERIVGNALSEGSEEYVQEILDPILRNIFLKEDNEVKLFTPEAAYAGLLGSMSGGMFELPGAIRAGVDTSNISNTDTTNGLQTEQNTAENSAKVENGAEGRTAAETDVFKDTAPDVIYNPTTEELNAKPAAKVTEIEIKSPARRLNPADYNSLYQAIRAKVKAMPWFNKPILNNDTDFAEKYGQLRARVADSTLRKGRSYRSQYGVEQLEIMEHLGELFENGKVINMKLNEETNNDVGRIITLLSPFRMSDGRTGIVKLNVKEVRNSNQVNKVHENKIVEITDYNIEGIEKETPHMQRPLSDDGTKIATNQSAEMSLEKRRTQEPQRDGGATDLNRSEEAFPDMSVSEMLEIFNRSGSETDKRYLPRGYNTETEVTEGQNTESLQPELRDSLETTDNLETTEEEAALPEQNTESLQPEATDDLTTTEEETAPPAEEEVQESAERAAMRRRALETVNRNSPDAQRIYREIMSNYGYGKVIQNMDAAAKKLGTKITYYAEDGRAEGYAEDGSIYLNVKNLRSTQEGVWRLFKHELSHTLQGATKAYGKLFSSKAGQELFNKFLKDNGYTNITELENEIRSRYSKNGKNLTEEELNYELMARFIEDSDILNSEESIRKLTEASPNLAQRIIEWFKYMRIRFKGTEYDKQLAQAERLYLKAVKEAQRNGAYSGGQETGRSYLFARNTDEGYSDIAERAERRGMSEEDIWNVLGLKRDSRGNWIREIDDSGAEFDAKGLTEGKLSDVFKHDELYREYPEAENIRFEFADLKGKNASYSPKKNKITLDNKYKNGNNTEATSKIIHELQHYLQSTEERSVGGSRDAAYNYLMNRAYERYSNTEEFKRLKNYKQRVKYLENKIKEAYGSNDLERILFNEYRAIEGEEEARAAANRQDMNIYERANDYPQYGRNGIDWTSEEFDNENVLRKRYSSTLGPKFAKTPLGGILNKKGGRMYDFEGIREDAASNTGRERNLQGGPFTQDQTVEGSNSGYVHYTDRNNSVGEKNGKTPGIGGETVQNGEISKNSTQVDGGKLRLAEGRKVESNRQYSIAEETEASRYSTEELLKDTSKALEARKQAESDYKAYEKAANKAKLTPKDRVFLDLLYKGTITEEDIPANSRSKIESVYPTYKACRDARQAIADSKKAARVPYKELAERAAEGSDGWQDKKRGISYSTEIMERNIEDITKRNGGRKNDEAKFINDNYFKPIHHNEAEATRYKNSLTERINALNLKNKKLYRVPVRDEISGVPTEQLVSERALVQLYGEGLITEQTLSKTGADVEKIKRAKEEMRSIYDELFDKANEALIRNGYEPIAKRADYFPHFTEDRPDTLLGKAAAAVGIDITGDALPTDIAGITNTFRPGKKWVGNFLRREGTKTDYDVLKGFDRYIGPVSDVIYHTDDIQRLRAFETELRYKYSDKGIQDRIEQIRNDETLTPEDRNNRLEALYKASKMSHLPNLVTQLRSYTDTLAGKKHKADRFIEDTAGRGVYKFLKSAYSKTGANMVAVNVGSWLTNFVPVTQALGVVRSDSMAKAIFDTIKAQVQSDGFVEKSDFLINRRGSENVSKTMGDIAAGYLTKPFEIIDNLSAEIVTRAIYYDNMRTSLNESTALEYANDMAARLMADRSKGAMPTAFNIQNPLVKTLTMFQLEANNQYKYYFKDVPADVRTRATGTLATAFFKMFLAAFLYNKLYKKIVGRNAAPDPIDIALTAAGNYKEAYKGNQSYFKATVSTAKDIAEEAPFIGGLLGGGRVPMSSVVPDAGKLLEAGIGLATGEMDEKKAMATITQELMNPALYLLMPIGGGQLKKTAQGLKTVWDGGEYTYDKDGNKKLKYPIDKSDPLKTKAKYVQAAVFGKSALPEAQYYYDQGFKALTVKQTEQYPKVIAAGITYQQYMEALMAARKAESDKDENGKTIPLSSARNKKRAIDKVADEYGLTERQRKILYEANGVSEKIL